ACKHVSAGTRRRERTGDRMTDGNLSGREHKPMMYRVESGQFCAEVLGCSPQRAVLAALMRKRLPKHFGLAVSMTPLPKRRPKHFSYLGHTLRALGIGFVEG